MIDQRRDSLDLWLIFVLGAWSFGWYISQKILRYLFVLPSNSRGLVQLVLERHVHAAFWFLDRETHQKLMGRVSDPSIVEKQADGFNMDITKRQEQVKKTRGRRNGNFRPGIGRTPEIQAKW